MQDGVRLRKTAWERQRSWGILASDTTTPSAYRAPRSFRSPGSDTGYLSPAGGDYKKSPAGPAEAPVFTTVSNLITRLPRLDDHAAWRVFDRRYSPLLNSYFRKAGIATPVAAELAQEALQRVATGLRAGAFEREKGRLRHWIGGIARNVLRNHLRRAAIRSTVHREPTGFWADHPDPDAQEAFALSDRRFDGIWVRARMSQLLRLAVQTFDRRDLRCYFLVEIRKLPIREVAERLSLSESAVYQKRRRVANWLLSVGPRFVSSWER